MGCAMTAALLWAALVSGAHDGLKVQGCGMDMGFALVYDLGRTLFGFGESCAKLGYMTGRNGDKGPETDGGYLLKQRWL